MNRANLEKLAAYLESLPADYQHFGMATFCENHGMTFERVNHAPEPTDCGTVACAVGHGPAAGLPAIEDDEGMGEDWYDYSDRVFELTDPEWMWCFCGAWKATDNTHQGAAKRIRYMLEHGAPENADDQAWGEAPYILAEG